MKLCPTYVKRPIFISFQSVCVSLLFSFCPPVLSALGFREKRYINDLHRLHCLLGGTCAGGLCIFSCSSSYYYVGCYNKLLLML